MSDGQSNLIEERITKLIPDTACILIRRPLVQGKLEVLTSAGLNQDEFSPEVTKFEVRHFNYFSDIGMYSDFYKSCRFYQE